MLQVAAPLAAADAEKLDAMGAMVSQCLAVALSDPNMNTKMARVIWQSSRMFVSLLEKEYGFVSSHGKGSTFQVDRRPRGGR